MKLDLPIFFLVDLSIYTLYQFTAWLGIEDFLSPTDCVCIEISGKKQSENHAKIICRVFILVAHNSWNRRKWDEPVVTMNGKIQWIGSDCIVSYNKHIWRSPLSPFQYFVGQTIIKKRRVIKITTDCSSPFHGRCVKCVPSTVLNCCCRLSLFLTVPLSPRNKFGKIVPCALTRGTLGSKECMFWCLSQAPW